MQNLWNLVYILLTAYLNPDARFSLEILGLHLNFDILTIKQCLPYCTILSKVKNTHLQFFKLGIITSVILF